MKRFLTSLLLTSLLCACADTSNYSAGSDTYKQLDTDKQLDQRKRENDRSGYDKPGDPLMRE